MRPGRAPLLVLAGVLLLACCPASAADTAPPSHGAAEKDKTRAAGLARLLRQTYPALMDQFAPDVVPGGNGYYLISRKDDQAPIPLLAAILVKHPPKEMPFPATLADTLARPYPAGAGGRMPAGGFDPGRTRCIPLLKALYGGSAEAVRANCETVDFLGQSVPFNRRHGASAALRRVAARLKNHLAAHPADTAYVLPLAGTFIWRPVKDTGQLSAHAFGIAIDLNADRGLYWLWRPSPERVTAVRRGYPQAVVDAFEAEGFIWGGKWSAFDFMHFEYRPELLHPAKPHAGSDSAGRPFFLKGAPKQPIIGEARASCAGRTIFRPPQPEDTPWPALSTRRTSLPPQ